MKILLFESKFVSFTFFRWGCYDGCWVLKSCSTLWHVIWIFCEVSADFGCPMISMILISDWRKYVTFVSACAQILSYSLLKLRRKYVTFVSTCAQILAYSRLKLWRKDHLFSHRQISLIGLCSSCSPVLYCSTEVVITYNYWTIVVHA